MGNERKIKRKIQIIVASAIVVLFALCVTLVVQLGTMANQDSMERSLAARHNQLQQQLQHEQGLLEFYLSDRFIDEFALRELGWGRPGSAIFR